MEEIMACRRMAHQTRGRMAKKLGVAAAAVAVALDLPHNHLLESPRAIISPTTKMMDGHGRKWASGIGLDASLGLGSQWYISLHIKCECSRLTIELVQTMVGYTQCKQHSIGALSNFYARCGAEIQVLQVMLLRAPVN